jgi:uncharacterized iron-regulated protein
MLSLYFNLGFLLIFIISFIKSDEEIIPTELSKTFMGKLEENTWRFYKLEIPSWVKINSTDLVFRVKESKNADSGIEDFSDPDIYVSKVKY